MKRNLLTLVMALAMVTAMAVCAVAETSSSDGDEDIVAMELEAGWVRDGVDGATWQDDRATLEIFLEDVDNFKVQITWASSATETTEWVYACDYDAETNALKARNAICDNVTFNEAGEENRTPVYEKDTSEAVFSLNAEGQVVLTNAGDEALEGKVFTYTGNLENDAQ